MKPKTNEVGLENYEWPMFKTERERIKHFSNLYKDVSIAEAFGLEPRPIVESLEKMDYKPNDTVWLKIQSITKKVVVFEQFNIKENIVCNTNLYQYSKFRDFIPTKSIPCKVLSNNNGKLVVDPFAAMLDDFILDRSTNLELQKNIKLPKPVQVHNLRLTRGGYIGGIKVTSLSDFIGENMYVEAFIPGSQIVQNIETDFEKWEGQTVTAFITNYISKPNSTNKIFICSCKEWINFQGQLNLISMFKHYCEDTPEWKDIIENKTWDGIITGICNSKKKCGVFVEIPSLHITGMVPCEPDVINSYIKNSEVKIRIKDFDELKTFNNEVGQLQHVEPYIIQQDILKKCNLRIVLEMV
jgi:ribosomal protein S1